MSVPAPSHTILLIRVVLLMNPLFTIMSGAPGQLETYQLPKYGFALRTEEVFLLERQCNAQMKATKTRRIRQTIK
jgi:hypothetical protein